MVGLPVQTRCNGLGTASGMVAVLLWTDDHNNLFAPARRCVQQQRQNPGLHPSGTLQNSVSGPISDPSDPFCPQKKQKSVRVRFHLRSAPPLILVYQYVVIYQLNLSSHDFINEGQVRVINIMKQHICPTHMS